MGGYQYSIPAIANATSYVWTVPPGAVISQGQATNAVAVDFGGSAVSGNITAAGINMCGTGTESSGSITVMVCTGKDENRLLPLVDIYPSPVHDLLNLSFKGNEQQLRVRITDVNGHSRYDGVFEDLQAGSKRQIDVSGFAKGIYMIRVTGDTRAFATKFAVD
jgi:hypothetical protein